MVKQKARDGIWKVCPCPKDAECVKRHGTWSWEARVGTDPKTGRPQRRAGNGLLTRADALAERRRVLAESSEGPVINDAGYTVEQWLKRWYHEMETRPEPPEAKTLQGYETNIRVMTPEIGAIRLRDLTRQHVEDMLRRLGEDRSGAERPEGRHGQWVNKRSVSTLGRYRATLRAALSAAVMEHRVRYNVATGSFGVLQRPKAAEAAAAAAPRETWAPDQTAHFFQVCANHRWALLYGAIALTGARRSEWLGARWGEMNPMRTSLLIRPSVVAIAGPQPCFVCGDTHLGRLLKPHPKSTSSVRWLPLPDQLQQGLKVLRLQQVQTRLHSAPWVDHDLIFADEDGGPLNPNDVTDEFKLLVEEAGLPELTGVHALRHNAVTMMLHQGTPVEEVAKLTGHHVTTLRKHYAHIIEEFARRSLQRHADAILGGWGQPPAAPGAVLAGAFQ